MATHIRKYYRFYPRQKIGWGGRIRTYTIRINSAVSYRLDHAPAELKHPVDSIAVAGSMVTLNVYPVHFKRRASDSV